MYIRGIFNKTVLAILSAAVLLSMDVCASGRDTINVVGSSTVFPFTTVVAERFGRASSFKTPRVESTGTGGGIKLFCAGEGIDTPDVANASRRMKRSEFELCRRHGVNNITEVLIGFDGIVVAASKQAKQVSFSRKVLFLALAKRVPTDDGSDTLIDNPYFNWSDIDPALADHPIEVLGPGPTSGTRDAFSELVLEQGCNHFAWIKELKSSHPKRYQTICHGVREDGRYIESGENDNLIVHKLLHNPLALGIFGFSFLSQNADKLQGAKIDNVTPDFASIANGQYVVSRPLYFYVKNAHEGKVPGIREFLVEFTSEVAIGVDGYLSYKGLIPLPESRRELVRSDVLSFKPMQF